MNQHSRAGGLLLLLAVLFLDCGSPPEPVQLPPSESWVGKEVQVQASQVLLGEPLGSPVGELPAGRPVRVVARQADEAGQLWLCVELDSLRGWLPQERTKPPQGEDGRIATH